MTEAALTSIDSSSRRARFFYLLLAVTWLPLLSLPLLSIAEFPFDGSLLLGLAVFAGGVGHVASTASAYADRSVREVMRPMKTRFYLLPAIALMVTVAALAWGSAMPIADGLTAALFMVHLLWLHYHYQKQNYGLVAFAAASAGRRIPYQLAWVLLLPALAGCLAMMPSLLDSAFAEVGFWRPFSQAMHLLSILAYLAGAIGLAYLVSRAPEAFRHPRVAIFATGAFCFFLPPMLLHDTEYAFWSYALAHGFQYLIMVFTLARGPRVSLLHMAAFAGSVILGGLLLHRLGGNNALFLCGILLTWVHFIVDARLWKMSDPGPRQLIRQRFAFLFD
jgi:hypothetical protein